MLNPFLFYFGVTFRNFMEKKIHYTIQEILGYI